MEQAGIEPVLIAAANTPEPDAAADRDLSKAYTYCVSRAGITGTHAGGAFDPSLVDRLTEPARRRPSSASGFRRPSMSARRSTPARAASFAARRSSIARRGAGTSRAFVRTLKAATRNDSPPQ